ncbi:MAG: MFS transporter [Bifidobacteriaceae bacterium]|nr:MFS transporter [Bifidobacteriaceae bacterium]
MASTMSSSAQRQPISRDQSSHDPNPDHQDPGSQRPRSQAPQDAALHVPWRTKLAIVSVGLLSFVGILTETSMNVTFPTLMRQMHVSLATVQWLTTGYLLLVTIVMSTTAYVLKRFSPRSLFVFALVMSALGTVMCLVAPNFPLLLAGRMLQAFATGIATPLMFQLIFTRVPLRRIGTYTGFASVIVSLAPALGPTYGGVLTSVWSWRAIFSGVLPLLVLIAIAGLISVRDEGAGAGAGAAGAGGGAGAAARRGASGLAFDAAGVALLAATFIAIIVTFDAAGLGGWAAPGFWIGIVVCAALGVAVAWHAKHGKRRLFDYAILRIRAVRLRLFGYVGLQLINIGMSFILPLYAQNVLGASAMQAGLMLLPGALLGAVASAVAGRIYDRCGARGTLGVSVGLMIVALALMLALTHSFTLVLIGVLYTLLRLGFNTGFGVTMSDASACVTGPRKSDLNSLFSMMQQFAGSFGTAVVSAVISAQILAQSAAGAAGSGAVAGAASAAAGAGAASAAGSATSASASAGTTTATVLGTITGSRIDFAILLVLALCMAAAIIASFRPTQSDRTA